MLFSIAKITIALRHVNVSACLHLEHFAEDRLAVNENQYFLSSIHLFSSLSRAAATADFFLWVTLYDVRSINTIVLHEYFLRGGFFR